ncbi:phage tail protein [Vibrio scophthalmi]|uniref:Phage tail fibre protein N-terminal domain-containing protein n=1 Tax=Vibrio scophthalmi LMG 19158 TaxID=870967 RepID=F9RKS3_9VIBR|nr:phage tail protein [Vibrio scophthalmi]EGU39397.1 hypothetical protein VIS19158_03866 [Vibrio scophthalmi LMG 19158]
MSQTAIPLEFEQYLQNKVSLKQPTDLNEIIFAMIPDLDLSQPIDRTISLPPLEQWVFQQDLDQIGKSGSNAVVYSVVLSGSTAPFTFNAMFLRDKNVPKSCGMVVYKATETKETGMALTKSMLMQFDGAAAAANVTIDAATWQIDYQARLKGMDEDHRLSCLDNYGHTAFVDGFDVTLHEVDQTKYLIVPGVAYVGGLRIQNALSTVQTVDSKPTTLWVDVYRDGTALSQHENLFKIVATTDDLVDYTDSENRPHYVAKLARIEADGSIVDLRVKGGLAEHEMLSQFLPYDSERVYTTGEICYTKDQATGELSYWQWYSNVESLAGKSPLLETNRHVGWSDNTKPFYWVPYTGDQIGMPFYWLDTSAPEWAVMEINVDLPSLVYWRLARRYPSLVFNRDGVSYINTGEIRAEFLRVLDQGRGVDANRQINTAQKGTVIAGNDDADTANTSIQNINIHREALGWEPADLSDVAMNVDLINWATGTSNSRLDNANLALWMGTSRSRNVARPMAIAI